MNYTKLRLRRTGKLLLIGSLVFIGFTDLNGAFPSGMDQAFADFALADQMEVEGGGAAVAEISPGAVYQALLDVRKRGASMDRVQELLDQGADANARDPRGKKGNTPIMLAANHGRFLPDGTVEILLEAGANPNIKNHRGKLPLNVAVKREDAATVEALLKGGADPTLKDTKGKAALDVAESEVVRNLIRQYLPGTGASVKSASKRG